MSRAKPVVCAMPGRSVKEVYMRIATVLVFSLGAMILSAQQPANKINIVPVQSTPAESGKDMFGAYCASCHGLNGKGAGPAASALKVAPADLTALARHNGGKYPAMQVLEYSERWDERCAWFEGHAGVGTDSFVDQSQRQPDRATANYESDFIHRVAADEVGVEGGGAIRHIARGLPH